MKTILVAEYYIRNKYGDLTYHPIRAKLTEPSEPTEEMKKWAEEHPNCREMA